MKVLIKDETPEEKDLYRLRGQEWGTGNRGCLTRKGRGFSNWIRNGVQTFRKSRRTMIMTKFFCRLNVNKNVILSYSGRYQ